MIIMIALPEKAPRVRRGTSGKQGHERNLRKRNRIRIESEKEVKDNEIKKPYHITHGEELRQALRDSRLTGTKHKKKGGGERYDFSFSFFFSLLSIFASRILPKNTQEYFCRPTRSSTLKTVNGTKCGNSHKKRQVSKEIGIIEAQTIETKKKKKSITEISEEF